MADHVCILDTGSTDGTWEKLQEQASIRPNLIIAQQTIVPWRYDEARNISMTLIPKDTTIFFMADLDEIIKEPNWCDVVKSCWDPLFDRGVYTYNRDVGPDDIVIRSIPEYRFHSRDWYKWVNIVHEALINHAGRKQFYIETCTEIPITVWHYPKEKKENDYADLCEDTLRENPQDYVMRLQLAIEYEIHERDGRAYEHYLNLLEDPGTLQDFEVARCCCSLGKITYKLDHDMQRALNYYREGRLIAPHVIDNYIAAAELYYNNKEYQKALDITQAGLENAQTARWCTTYEPHSYFPYWILGMSNYFLNNYILALGYMSIALAKNPSEDIKSLYDNILAEIIKKEKD